MFNLFLFISGFTVNTHTRFRRDIPPPKTFPLLDVLTLKNRNEFTWYYINYPQWKKLSTKPKLSFYKRELRTVNRVFRDLMLFYPWLRFKQTNNWARADIRFSYSSDTNYDDRSHVHPGLLPADIHLAKSFWEMHTKFQYTILFHEVQHLLGNADNNNNHSIMSSGGVYLFRRPFYRDIVTSTYARFKRNYKKHLISYKRFKYVINRMNQWTKKYDATL